MIHRPLYFDHEPRGLVARLFICFQLTPTRWVCYARKESPPMRPEYHRADAAAIICPLLVEAWASYRLALQHIVERAQHIEDLLALLETEKETR